MKVTGDIFKCKEIECGHIFQGILRFAGFVPQGADPAVPRYIRFGIQLVIAFICTKVGFWKGSRKVLVALNVRSFALTQVLNTFKALKLSRMYHTENKLYIKLKIKACG